MDYESVKDQWGQIEDRDGIRLSWNTFPSSRMVCDIQDLMKTNAVPNIMTGSFSSRWYDNLPQSMLDHSPTNTLL